MLDRVLEIQNAKLALRLVADVDVILVHENNDTWHLRAIVRRPEKMQSQALPHGLA